MKSRFWATLSLTLLFSLVLLAALPAAGLHRRRARQQPIPRR